MKFGLRLFSIAAALASTVTAHAADLGARPNMKTPALDPLYDWSGFYAGLNVGYGWGGSPVTLAETPPYQAFAGPAHGPTIAGDAAGVLGGAQVGYNMQIHQWLLGVEADLDGVDIAKKEKVVRTAPAFGAVPFTTSGEQKLDLFGTVRGRIGWTFDRVLIYGTGGLAYGRASIASLTGSPGGGASTAAFCAAGGFADCTNRSTSKTLVGTAWGGGIEWAFAGNWSVKAEYLHYDLGNISFIAPNVYNPLDPFHTSLDVKGDIVRAGVNYKFGGAGAY